MTTAHGADGEKVLSGGATKGNQSPKAATPKIKSEYSRRHDEVSAGGLVINTMKTHGLLIGRFDLKNKDAKKILWSLPKGHIESGETPEDAAIREVKEETGIDSEVEKSLGVIDFWFMAGGKRIHKTVHHFLFREIGGELAPQFSEVDRVDWFPLDQLISTLAYSDERKLLKRAGDFFHE
jgi:ADP-ribose pyrophosphatase YjhB (NUDIX family)